MVKEAKDLLNAMLLENAALGLSLTKVVRNAADEKQAVMERAHPFASLITSPGSFNNDTSGIRSFKGEDGVVKKYLRGDWSLPIAIRIWAKTEEDADAIVSAFMPYIPHRWVYQGIEGTIEIQRTEASDFASAMSGQYVAAVVVSFTAAAARGM
ncbi:MAG TPA: hypothetical protein VN445_09050 [Rectinemataceae bacterium]|nr:hypothetical protein [Rectinemataceae bacterium]